MFLGLRAVDGVASSGITVYAIYENMVAGTAAGIAAGWMVVDWNYLVVWVKVYRVLV